MPRTISWVGTTIGLPFAGERILLTDIISTLASICASIERGTCTAIWSPSKSALKAVQTKGCNFIALPSTEDILRAVAAVMGENRKQARQVGMHLCHKYSGENLRGLGELFNVGVCNNGSKPSAYEEDGKK